MKIKPIVISALQIFLTRLCTKTVSPSCSSNCSYHPLLQEQLLRGNIINPMSSTNSSSLYLNKQTASVVQIAVSGRNGTVLSRKAILKEDHFNKQVTTHLDPSLVGAPNFRQASPYNVYGVAQPSASGYGTVLKHLIRSNNNNNGNNGKTPLTLAWINMREEPFIYLNDTPFVVRDADSPFQNVKAFTGVDYERLEAVEQRLVQDIREESAQNGGLITVHLEDEKGDLCPSLVTVDSLATPREIFEISLKKVDSFLPASSRIIYRRVPVSSYQYQFAGEEFLDYFIHLSHQIPKDASIVVSCGMGMGRTTVGMIICYMIKAIEEKKEQIALMKDKPLTDLAMIVQVVHLLEKIGEANSDLFRNALFECLGDEGESCKVVASFQDALAGNYTIIRDLCRALDNGIECKQFLDYAINSCGQVLNLKESILFQRVKHSLQLLNKHTQRQHLHLDDSCIDFAIRSIERYFLLIVFSSYLLEGNLKNDSCKFSDWIKERREICNIFQNIHKFPSTQVFHPVIDLNQMIECHLRRKNLQIPSPCKASPPTPYQGGLDEFEYVNEQVEQSKFVLKERNGSVLNQGMILKYDTYAEVNQSYNFRQIENIIGVAQPNQEAITFITSLNHQSSEQNEPTKRTSLPNSTVWINLREEPIVYLNGQPYVLRDAHSWLRNIKTYSGISAARIESMELRLKIDIIEEIKKYNGKLLLHSESQDGQLMTYWQTIDSVCTPRELFEAENLMYYRIPMTAEIAPEKRFFDQLFKVVRKHSTSCTYVLNCQLGKGRSTTGMIVVKQCLDLLASARDTPQQSGSTPFYKSVLSLVRSVTNGLEIKNRLDSIIDQTSQTVHLVRRIDEYRELSSERAASLGEAQFYLLRGIEYLKRYYYLFAFEAYLDHVQLKQDEVSFAYWMNSHLELKKILLEIGHTHPLLSCLIPQSLMKPGEIMSSTPPDIIEAIDNRSGSVLAHRMILKHDHFLGCQRMTLPDRIDGAPNFRQVPIDFVDSKTRYLVCGIGMPEERAIINLVTKLGTEKNILWTSFREEPILFIKGEPYVLRFFQEPLANIESTGITRERIESIEDRLKQDVLNELKQFNGKILLHEEQAGGSNLGFSIIHNWVEATPNDVKTSKEIYIDAMKQFPLLSYRRIPITDEQAPLPSVIDELYHLIVSKNRIDSQGDPVNLVFNCQMGRGRTTTGMVVATIIEICRDVNRFVGLNVPDQVKTINQRGGSEDVRYLKGEYKIILQLISTLQHGKEAKVVADKAIDLCNHMQNLREAIYTEFVVKLPTIRKEKEEAVYEETRERAINYLMRYFALIVFADYALGKNEQQFSEWLKIRKEISHLQSNRHEFVVEF